MTLYTLAAIPDLDKLVQQELANASPKKRWLDMLGECTLGPTAENKGWREPSDVGAPAAPEDGKWAQLEGRNVYLVGSDGELNSLVAARLAVDIGYAAVSSTQLVELVAGQEFGQLSVEEVVDSEEAVLQQLSKTPDACVVGTCGGDASTLRGAPAWTNMGVGVTIWLDPSGFPDTNSDTTDMDSDMDRETDCDEKERDTYKSVDIRVQFPGKPKEECYINEVTGNIHIGGGVWTPLLLDDILKQTTQALERFLR
eukprot:gene4858-5933_t